MVFLHSEEKKTQLFEVVVLKASLRFSSHLGMTAMPATQLLPTSTIHLGWTHRHVHTFSSAS